MASSDLEATATVDTRVSGQMTKPTVPSGASGGASTGSTARVTTPSEALHLDEARRIRILSFFAATVCILGAALLVPIGGHTGAKVAHAITLLTLGAASAWIWIYLRDLDRYEPWVVSVFSVFSGAALATTFVFWGVYSSGVLFVPIAMYFVSAGKSVTPAIVLLVFACIPHGILGILTASGVVEDVGVVRAWVLRPYEQLAVIGIAQFAFLVTFLLARGTRRSISDAIEQLDGAVRGIAKREALLAEAKQDLERALQIGGPGLYTDQIVGSFRLGNVLGRGAMGEVYEATHNQTGEPAAVKVLTPSAGSDPSLVKRFLREVQIAASLEAENVVKVLEVPQGIGSVPYLAMERLEGESLAEVLRHRSRFDPARTIKLVSEVAQGIGAAHEAGIVHRDLKPRNVFLHNSDGKEIWKILDFGVSKLAGASATLTKGHLVGTPSYMAPEQARGKQVDRRADVYALGVMVYRVLTGRPAFSGGDVPAILYAVTHSMPPKPSLMARLPASVDSALAVALAKDPDQRFSTAVELADAVEIALGGGIDAELNERARKVLAELDWGACR